MQAFSVSIFLRDIPAMPKCIRILSNDKPNTNTTYSGGVCIWRARKDSNLRPSESELTDYFGLIIRNLEYPPVIAYNPELISLVICEKIRNLRQSIATSRGHMRQKMRQKFKLNIQYSMTKLAIYDKLKKRCFYE